MKNVLVVSVLTIIALFSMIQYADAQTFDPDAVPMLGPRESADFENSQTTVEECSSNGNGTSICHQRAWPDSDADGLTDHSEFLLGTDPLDADTDDDNLSDLMEIRNYQTSPLIYDSINPGVSDYNHFMRADGTVYDADSDGVVDTEDQCLLMFGVRIQPEELVGCPTTPFYPTGELRSPISPTMQPPQNNRGGGGCSGDCTPPTLGKSKSTDRLIVEDGFSFNGVPVDVTDYHTEYPLIETEVGVENMLVVKVYENQGLENIMRVQFGLGMEEIGDPLNHAEALVNVELERQGIDIREIIITDQNNILANVTAATAHVPCDSQSLEHNCLLLGLKYTHNEAPIYNAVLITTSDFSRNTQNNYLNEGYDVLGESLNPAPVESVASSFAANKMYPVNRGLIDLVRIDKDNDIWEDNFGYKWQKDNYGFDLISNIKVPQCNDKPLDSINVPTRDNCHFRALTTVWEK